MRREYIINIISDAAMSALILLPGGYAMKRIAFATFLAVLLLGFFVFAVTAAKSTVTGDVDGDGFATLNDAQLIFDYVSGTGSLTRDELSAADIDGDGRVTVADAAQLFHYVNGTLRSIPYVKREGGVLTLLSLPEKITYNAGEELDLSGMRLAISYSGGESKEITDYTVSGFDSTAGIKIIIVSYDGMKTAFTVTVFPKEIAEIGFSSLPDKLRYSRGEELDLTGMVVTAYYSDGTYEDITEYAVSGFTGDEGVNTIKIQCGGHTLSFDVTVGG